MSPAEIVRAWRDREYWLSLTDEERAATAENPAGVIELIDEEMDFVAGGSATLPSQTCTSQCLSTFTATGHCCY